MTTLLQATKRPIKLPVRRCYIKRRNMDGTYESSWFRIDNYRSKARVNSWGSYSLEIDYQPGEIAAFNISDLQISFLNTDGAFNVESDDRSIWYGYLNRKYTKLKIEAGYYDTDWTTEIGVANVFEGIIDGVEFSDSDDCRCTVLPYTALLNEESIFDISLAIPKTINELVNLIMNQAKITDYIPYIAADAAINSTVYCSVYTIAVTAGGSGYTSAPEVVLTGGGGSGATATANVVAGVVTSITVTERGNGYATAPTISFTGGGGSSASATATLRNSAFLGNAAETYWNVLKQLAWKSKSIPMLVGNAWTFTSRAATGSVIFDFVGAGLPNPNIREVTKYDDEGADRVRLRWECDSSNGAILSAVSTNTTYLLKYKTAPQKLSLDELEDADKQDVLDGYLTDFEPPRQKIEFTTRFYVNMLKPKDRITIRIDGPIQNLSTGSFWDDGAEFDDGVWDAIYGSIYIQGSEWMITRVVKDLDTWMSRINAEEII